MNSTDRRLAKLEAAASKTATVEVELKEVGRDCVKMDLLDAIHLFVQGKVRAIRAIMTPGEEHKHLSETIADIEAYMAARRAQKEE